MFILHIKISFSLDTVKSLLILSSYKERFLKKTGEGVFLCDLCQCAKDGNIGEQQFCHVLGVV